MASGEVDIEELRQRFAMQARHIRTIAESVLTEYFGERCVEFDDHCDCCRRWKLLDDLTANPFED